GCGSTMMSPQIQTLKCKSCRSGWLHQPDTWHSPYMKVGSVAALLDPTYGKSGVIGNFAARRGRDPGPLRCRCRAETVRAFRARRWRGHAPARAAVPAI